MPSIFQTQTGVTLVGGAEVAPATLAMALDWAPELVAADGGANALDDLGHTPRAVIGDLDSIRPELRQRLGARVHHLPEQDSTDLDKCLRSIDAPFILGVGFLGARLDHTFAAMASLVQHGSARVVLIGPQDICLLVPPRLDMSLGQGARVSLVPMGHVSGKSTGLEWPIDGIDLAPDGRIGTSNRMASDRLGLSMSVPKMLLLLERNALGAALTATLGAHDW